MPADERQRARAPRRKRARPSSQPPVMPRDDAHHRCTHPQRSATGPPPRRLPFFATPRSHSHLLHTSCAPTSSSRGHSYRDKADRERGGRRRGVVDGGRATSRAAPQQQTSRKEKGCPCFFSLSREGGITSRPGSLAPGARGSAGAIFAGVPATGGAKRSLISAVIAVAIVCHGRPGSSPHPPPPRSVGAERRGRRAAADDPPITPPPVG